MKVYRDSLLNMFHSPGGDWHPGWGVDLRFPSIRPKIQPLFLFEGPPLEWVFFVDQPTNQKAHPHIIGFCFGVGGDSPFIFTKVNPNLPKRNP